MMRLKAWNRTRKSTAIVAAVLGLAASLYAGPPAVFGTKTDSAPAASPGPGMGYAPFFQMMLALGIVFVLVKYVLPKLLGGINKKLAAKSSGGIEVEESASIGGVNLFVVSVRGKSLLLGASQAGLTCLADLGPKKIEAEPPLFMDMLDRETQQPSHIYVDQQGEPSQAMRSTLTDEEVQAALERLNKLGG